MSKLRLSFTTVKSLINTRLRFLPLVLIATGIGFAVTGLAKIGLRVTAANKAKAAQTGNTHKLVAAYYSVRENLNATLMLSNQGPMQLPVRISLFSRGGAKLDLPAITLGSNEVRAIDLRQSIGAASSFEEGSVAVDYEGRPLELGGLVVLMNAAQSLVFEEELVEPAKAFASTRLEGVWWRPTGSTEARLVLSNTTNAAVSLTVNTREEGQGNSHPQTLTLAPRETRVLNTEAHNGNDELDLHGTAGGISINYAGAPGTVVAHGMMQEPSKGFSNVIDFSDPQKAKLTRLDGTGLRFGTVAGKLLSQVAVVRNLGNAPTTVSGRLPYTLSNGNQATATIQSFQLAPGDVKKVNLPTIAAANQVTAAGLEFTYTGNSGSVVASALSYSSDRNHVFRVPMRDASTQASSTGNYPWSISALSATQVYIKNSSDSPKQFTVSLNFGGQDYVPGVQNIAAGQTLVFDVRKLRDEQTPDANGHVIPLSVTQGQLHWSILGAGAAYKALIGRAEQPDASSGLSMTSACGVCCPDNFQYGWLTPGSVSGFIGGVTSFLSWRTDTDCYGLVKQYQFSGYPGWSSDNPAVATCNGSGVATAVGLGSTWIRQQYYVDLYTPNVEDCLVTSTTADAAASCEVQIQVSLSYPQGLGIPLSQGTAPQGSPAYVNSIIITGTATPAGGTWSWTTTSNKVSLMNANSATVTIKSITQSGAAGDVPIKLTYTYNGTTVENNDIKCTVQKPTSFEWYSTTIDKANTGCPSGSAGWDKTMSWQLKDHLGGDIQRAIPCWDTMNNNAPNSCLVPAQGEGTAPGPTTNGNGIWGHRYQICSPACLNGGNCGLTGTQNYTVNGYSINLPYTMACNSITVAGK